MRIWLIFLVFIAFMFFVFKSRQTESLMTTEEVKKLFSSNKTIFEEIDTWFTKNRSVLVINNLSDETGLGERKILKLMKKAQIQVVTTKTQTEKGTLPRGLNFYMGSYYENDLKIIYNKYSDPFLKHQTYYLLETSIREDCDNTLLAPNWILYKCKRTDER